MYVPLLNRNNRERADQVAYDYSFNYQEFTNMSLAVLQETRKEYKEYKETSEERISNLENENESLKSQLSDILIKLSEIESKL